MRKLILIVEDNEINRELLVQTLEDSYDLLEAENGKRGVELARLHTPDVILMDLMMPVMHGWAATRELRSIPSTAHIPIIVLSAHDGDRERHDALQAGANDFITKPVDDDLLIRVIQKYVR